MTFADEDDDDMLVDDVIKDTRNNVQVEKDNIERKMCEKKDSILYLQDLKESILKDRDHQGGGKNGKKGGMNRNDVHYEGGQAVPPDSEEITALKEIQKTLVKIQIGFDDDVIYLYERLSKFKCMKKTMEMIRDEPGGVYNARNDGELRDAGGNILDTHFHNNVQIPNNNNAQNLDLIDQFQKYYEELLPELKYPLIGSSDKLYKNYIDLAVKLGVRDEVAAVAVSSGYGVIADLNPEPFVDDAMIQAPPRKKVSFEEYEKRFFENVDRRERFYMLYKHVHNSLNLLRLIIHNDFTQAHLEQVNDIINDGRYINQLEEVDNICLLYTSPSPRD